MRLKNYTLAAVFLLLAISASAQRSDLDSNQKVAFEYLDSIKHYKETKQRDKLKSIKREYTTFNKSSRYRYSKRFGICASYMQQYLGLKEHAIITKTNPFFIKGAGAGLQVHLTPEFTIESGLAIMANNKKLLYSADLLVEERASDSMKIIKHAEADNRTSLYSFYFQAYYKIPLGKEITVEPFMRISYNDLNVSQDATYFLVGKANNYNEIITGGRYKVNTIGLHPGVALGFRLTPDVKIIASTAYSIHSAQASSSENENNLLLVTSSVKDYPSNTQIEVPTMKNGLMINFGFQIFFHPHKYAHEKGYNNPAYYDRVVY